MDEPSDEHPVHEMFTVHYPTGQSIGARLGRLALHGRNTIETPHYIAATSRGVVPHLTPDVYGRDTRIAGTYMGLEDFIERTPQKIPVLSESLSATATTSILRNFVGLPESSLLVLGARRISPVIAPAANPNTTTTVSVCTSVGFKTLNSDEYAKAVEKLKPDIAIALADVPYGRVLSSKRVEKATDRNIQWLQDHIARRKLRRPSNLQPALFAPLLAVPFAHQQFYVDCLTHDVFHDVSGLAFHGIDTLKDIPEELGHLPRLTLTDPPTPLDMLYHIQHGVDIISTTFVNGASDAGIALHFSFPPPQHSDAVDSIAKHALGTDMWLPTHATDLSPLSKDCACYACTNHHRAYLQHLLNAKEMLGWVLLQIHNYHVLDRFFADVRRVIGQRGFDDELARFASHYEEHLPEKTGQGPRLRGYQYKSEGPYEGKKNVAPFTVLRDATMEAIPRPIHLNGDSGDPTKQVLKD